MGAPVKASRELARAVEDERHRAEVDAAKKRAVGQLSDYDTFRNMVSVAHLRPLQADDRVDRGAAAAAWSFDGAGRAVAEAAPGAGGAASTEATAPSGDAGGALPDEPPRNRDEFLAAWRRARGTPGGGWALLRLCGAERLGGLFRVEIEGKLLGEIVATAAAAVGAAGVGGAEAGGCGPGGSQIEAADHHLAVELLLSLAETGRFGLAKALAGRACAGQAASILSSARDALCGCEGDRLVLRAAEAFGVPVPTGEWTSARAGSGEGVGRQ